MKTNVKRISPGILSFKKIYRTEGMIKYIEHNTIHKQFKFLQMQSMMKETLNIQAIHI